MCGIAGFYNLKSDNRVNIEKMLNAISHRGPDGRDVWDDGCYPGLTLGHVRLSIIDLSDKGSQPMRSHSGRFVISYNGEIYNTRDLIKNLKDIGYYDSMKGTSDTEILLEACEHLGVEETLKLCRGMFAFALYDVQNKMLTLARDRIGEKPLYYGFVRDSFVFASELDAIRELDGFEGDINSDVMPLYIKYGYIPAPETIYNNIRKLEPGCTLKIKCELDKYRDFSIEKYWDITAVAAHGQQSLFSGTRQEAADELDRLLRISIKDQMVSDVPLGAFLSGGIDSATVVSLMQAQSDRPVKTFTIGFEESDFDESDAAGRIAASLGTEHTQLVATKKDAIDAIPLMPHMFGEPFGDSSQIPTYMVSRLTRQHVTVSLSGDGGDELFGGYRDYRGVYSIYNRIRRIPLWMRRCAGSLMEHIPGGSERSRKISAHGTLLKARDAADLYRRTYETWRDQGGLCKSDPGNNSPQARGISLFDPVHTAMLSDMMMYHPDDILTKVDRTAMAVSLETRVPMLDRDVVEFAWTLPLEYIFDGNTGKLLLRDVLYRYVDPELMNRPKQGFGVPIARWILEGELRDWAESMMDPVLIRRYGLLNADETVRMWRDYTDRGVWRPQIWYILMLNAWCSR